MPKEQKPTLEGEIKLPEAEEKTPKERLEGVKEFFVNGSLYEAQANLTATRGEQPKEYKKGIDNRHRLFSPSKELVGDVPQVLVEMRRALTEVQAAQKQGDKKAEELAQKRLDDLYMTGTDWYDEAARDAQGGPTSIRFRQENLEKVPNNRKYAEEKYSGYATLVEAGGKGPKAEQIADDYRLGKIVEDIQKLTPGQQAALGAEFEKTRKEIEATLDERERVAREDKIPEGEKEKVFADVDKKCAELATRIETVRKAVVNAGYEWSKDKRKVVVRE